MHRTRVSPRRGIAYVSAWSISVFMFMILICPQAGAQDARVGVRSVEDLLERVTTHHTEVAAEVEELRRTLARDREELEEKLARLRAEVNQLEDTRTRLKERVDTRRTELEAQKKMEKEHNQRHEELLGSIRTRVADVAEMVENSPVTALDPRQDEALQDILAEDAAAGMDEVRAMRDIMLAQIRAAAQVQHRELKIVNRAGKHMDAEVVLLGAFTAMYRSESEVGFALYSPPSRQLLALSRAPGYTLKNAIRNYLDGETEAAPIDIGHGAALRQMTYERGLGEQVKYGGFIVWPILGIGLVALVLIFERIWFLTRQRQNAEAILNSLQPDIATRDWDACAATCARYNVAPARVFRAALPYVDGSRAELENVLQEAILAEIPAQERFLSTLGVLASIAPLLGLLGTVTGMIHTFELITFHGTGDPRMLSSGISEALVTTMFGLGVAIPIMLAHSLISRRVEERIADLEEKAISFVNRVSKVRQEQHAALAKGQE